MAGEALAEATSKDKDKDPPRGGKAPSPKIRIYIN